MVDMFCTGPDVKLLPQFDGQCPLYYIFTMLLPEAEVCTLTPLESNQTKGTFSPTNVAFYQPLLLKYIVM